MVWKLLSRRSQPEVVAADDMRADLGTVPGTPLFADRTSARLALRFMRQVLGEPELLPGHLLLAEKMVLDDLRQRCIDAPLEDDMVPRLPAVVPQVLRTLRQPKTSAEDLARVISGDTTLVTDVVRLANSPGLGVGRKIDSLSQAVVLLGDSGLRRLLMTAAMRPIIDARSGLISAEGASRLWRKNQRAALAADFFAQRLATPRFAAFLSGLLSQIGLLVLARALAASGQPGFRSVSAPFLVELDTLARRVAVRVCGQWEMPALVTATAGALAGDASANAPGKLVQVVLAADLLARYALLDENGALEEAEDADGFGLDGVSETLAEACLAAMREAEAAAA